MEVVGGVRASRGAGVVHFHRPSSLPSYTVQPSQNPCMNPESQNDHDCDASPGVPRSQQWTFVFDAHAPGHPRVYSIVDVRRTPYADG